MAGVAARLTSPDRAFERLYRRHVEDVYRYALAVLTNRADAEDVVQTTFMNAYRSYRSGNRPDQPLNWLITIAHNVCRQRFRSAARRPSEVALDPDLTAAADDQERPFRNEDIRRALSALTFTQRSALAMRELEGRSYKEIAATLGVTESAVETLIFRARKAFREQLEGTLSCSEAERAISRQLDGTLARRERGALRAHLRECEECASLARRFRAQRSALEGLVLLPLPKSLASFSGGGSSIAAGGASVGAALGLKALVLGSAALVAVGVGTTEIVTHSRARPAPAAPAEPAPALAAQHRPAHVRAATPTPAAPARLAAERRSKSSGHTASAAVAVRPETNQAETNHTVVPRRPRPVRGGGIAAAVPPGPAAAHGSGVPRGSAAQARATGRSEQAAQHGKPAGSPGAQARGKSAGAGRPVTRPTPGDHPGQGGGQADQGNNGADGNQGQGQGQSKPDTGTPPAAGPPSDPGPPLTLPVTLPTPPDVPAVTPPGQAGAPGVGHVKKP